MVKKLTSYPERVHPKDKMQRIMSVARHHLSHFGFSKVTMDDIAADLGMVKGGLYYYFPTKESLFKAVVVEEQQRFASLVREMMEKPIAASEKLRRYALMRMGFFRDMVNFIPADVHAWEAMSMTMRDTFREFEQIEMGFLQQIILEGRRSGEFQAEHGKGAAELFLHVLQGLRFRVLRLSPGTQLDQQAYGDLEKEVQLLTDIVLSGILRR